MVSVAVDREQILDLLGAIPDPEIPVLTLADLGVVRDVRVGEVVEIDLTPTYTGCPATEYIEASVVETLADHGIDDARVRRVLSPPWTTDWISAAGREKLRAYGIAPPAPGAGKRAVTGGQGQIRCPRCDSERTKLVSEFGSTPCKAAYRCGACLEPFEYFKCI